MTYSVSPMMYLVVLSMVIICGLALMLLRKNLVIILLGLYLSLNASFMIFAVAGKYYVKSIEGQVIAFVLLVGVQSLLIAALAILVRKHDTDGSIMIDEMEEFKH